MYTNVVSVTFLGTSHHRETHHSVLTQVFDYIQRSSLAPHSVVAAWLIDGPGCKGSIDNPMPGTYIYKDKKKIVSEKKIVSQWLHHFHKFLRQAYSQITGDGVESSLLEASIYLEEIIVQNDGKLPQKINLQGFSRGADACVRFANIIHRLHPEIEINIFLIDPAPGPGRHDDPDSYIVPPNVNSFNCSLMLNEHFYPYRPQHQGRYIFQNQKTRVAMNTYAGRHGAGLTQAVNDKLAPVSTRKLTQDALLRFNIEHGSLPADAKLQSQYTKQSKGASNKPLAQAQGLMSLEERLQNYCQCMDSFKSLTNRFAVKRKLYYSRTILKMRSDYLLDHDIFLDQEHRELFKAVFPKTFNWYFEKNIKKLTYGEIVEELNVLQGREYGHFYQALMKKFYPDDLFKPCGLAQQERPLYGQALVHDELSYLRYSLQTIVSYYHYRRPTLEKSMINNAQMLQIRTVLRESRKMDDVSAIKALRQLISTIKSKEGSGFIDKEVSKIIHEPDKYLDQVIKTLVAYEEKLPEAHADLVNDALSLIEAEKQDSHKDDYQKRLVVQSYLVGLEAALVILDKDTAVPPPESLALSKCLVAMTQPSYAETKYIDNIIRELESYVYWRSFLSYFPTQFGFNIKKIELASQLIGELKNIRLSGNAVQVQHLLEKATQGPNFRESHNNLFWLDYLRFKSDYLNKIILNNLQEVIAITSIFSHTGHGPDAKPQSFR